MVIPHYYSAYFNRRQNQMKRIGGNVFICRLNNPWDKPRQKTTYFNYV